MTKFVSCNNIIYQKNNKQIELLLILLSNPLLIKYYYLNTLIKYYETKYIIARVQITNKKNIIRNILKYLYINLKKYIFLIDLTNIIEFDDNIKTEHLDILEKTKIINNFNAIVYKIKKKFKDDIKYIIDNNE